MQIIISKNWKWRYGLFPISLILIIGLFASHAKAQQGDKLFLEIPQLQDLQALRTGLPDKQKHLLEVQMNQKTTEAVRIDKLDVSKLQIDKMVNINLFPDQNYLFMGKEVEKRMQNNYTWYGVLESKEEKGDAVLVVNHGNVTGNVRVGEKLFSIRPLAKGQHMIIQVDPKKMPRDCPPEFDRTPIILHEIDSTDIDTAQSGEVVAPNSFTIEANQIISQQTSGIAGEPEASDYFGYALASGDFNGDKSADLAVGVPFEDIKNNTVKDGGAVNIIYGSPVINVMVAYTTAVNNAVADIGALIQLAVDETNRSYRNSRINIRMNLAHSVAVSYTESGSFDTDLSRLRNNNDTYMDNIHSLRDQHTADIVILLINDDQYCGMASGIDASAGGAFAVVYYECATGNYSFGHEIGHLQGARHDEFVDNNTNPYPYGHGFVNVTDRWRSIMAYNDQCDCSDEVTPCPAFDARRTPGSPGCARLQYWSNPHVKYNGDAMGTTQKNDNTRVLNKTAIKVSAFRNPSAGDHVWSQAATGAEGEPEDNDLYGYSLAAADFNKDGYTDLAIGVPNEDIKENTVNDGGAVNILYGSANGLTIARDQIWSQHTSGIEGEPEAGDKFGFALTTGDFNRDGYADIAIGVPYEDIKNNEADDGGAVNVIYGSSKGLSAANDQIWSQETSGIAGAAEKGDLFGYALATGDFDKDGYTDLAIGVPNEDIRNNEVADGGAVNILYGSSTGLVSARCQIWSQETSGIEGAPEKGDRFGYALTTGDYNKDGYADLAIGVPFEDIKNNTEDDGGAVNVLYGSSSGLRMAENQIWSQESSGIAGEAERGDHFGQSLTSGDFNGDGYTDLVVGVPDEDVKNNTRDNGGAVNVIYGSTGRLTASGNQLWSQDASGIEGVPENDDRFGFAITSGDFNRDGFVDIAIGVPFEDIKENIKVDGGAVNLLFGR